MFDIGVDLDGVTHNFIQSFRKYVIDAGIRRPEQCLEESVTDFFNEWRDDDGVGIGREEFLEICHAGVDADVIFYYGAAFDDAKAAFDRIKAMGHRIHIITDRPFGTDGYARDLTERWLAENELPYDTLTISADKTNPKTDIMIDDKVQNYDELANDGCYAVLYDRPWNQEPGDRRRVSSLGEFADLVEWLTFMEVEFYGTALD